MEGTFICGTVGTFIGPKVGFIGGKVGTLGTIWGLLREQTTKSPSVRIVWGLILLRPH